MSLADEMKKWQSTRIFSDEICCLKSHEYYNGALKIIPKPDEYVCEREKAWRNYVRKRDNNPQFPFDRKWLIGDSHVG